MSMSMRGLGSGEYEAVKGLYQVSRTVVNMMVKIGKIPPSAANCEWAKRVAAGLIKDGHKIPSTILSILSKCKM